MKKLTASLLLCACVSPAFANNIITAEHPPFGDKGWALQLDDRLIYTKATVLLDRKGNESAKETTLASNLFITRLYIPGWLFRLSIPYSRLEISDKSRSAIGDIVMEAGASREYGSWRLRALLFASAPVSKFDAARTNVGAGAWSAGPNISITRYLADKKYDLNLWAQYAFNFTNPESRVKAGNAFSYAAAASALLNPGVPVRAAIEQRGLLADPNAIRESSRGQWGKTQLSVGPSFMVNMQKYLRGLTLWPTAQFDFYNRNTQRTALYYLKVQYNY